MHYMDNMIRKAREAVLLNEARYYLSHAFTVCLIAGQLKSWVWDRYYPDTTLDTNDPTHKHDSGAKQSVSVMVDETI